MSVHGINPPRRLDGEPPTQVSVVIPTLNEARTVDTAIAPLSGVAGIEVIVVDGGSVDGTGAIAWRRGARVIRASPGRAEQMNAGAAEATGDALLFLHADTSVDAKHVRSAAEILNRSRASWGTFAAVIESHRPGLGMIGFGMNLRSRVLRLPYGDQGLFIRTRTFRELGGFRPMAFMEDVELVWRLRRTGRFIVLPGPIRVSDRHWMRHGACRPAVVNTLMVALFACGAPVPVLYGLYRRWLPPTGGCMSREGHRGGDGRPATIASVDTQGGGK